MVIGYAARQQRAGTESPFHANRDLADEWGTIANCRFIEFRVYVPLFQ